MGACTLRIAGTWRRGVVGALCATSLLVAACSGGGNAPGAAQSAPQTSGPAPTNRFDALVNSPMVEQRPTPETATLLRVPKWKSNQISQQPNAGKAREAAEKQRG